MILYRDISHAVYRLDILTSENISCNVSRTDYYFSGIVIELYFFPVATEDLDK